MVCRLPESWAQRAFRFSADLAPRELVSLDLAILAEPVAGRAGFAGLVLACEPARHRREPLAVTAGEANL